MYIQKFPHCRELQGLSAGSSVIAIFFSHLSDDAEVSFFVHTSHTSCKLMIGAKPVCKRAPIIPRLLLTFAMKKYFILTCLLFSLISFIMLMALYQHYRRDLFFSEDLELDCACAWWVRKHVEMECFFARGFQ